MTFRVDVGYEQARIQSVHPAAGPDDPATVRTPAMIAVGIGAVDFIKPMESAVLKVNHPQVRVLVPDCETSIGRFCEKQEPSVGGDPWESGVKSGFTGIVDGVNLVSEGERIRIERDGTNAVTDVLLTFGNFLFGGRTEIKGLPVRRESGERLKPGGVGQQRRS